MVWIQFWLPRGSGSRSAASPAGGLITARASFSMPTMAGGCGSILLAAGVHLGISDFRRWATRLLDHPVSSDGRSLMYVNLNDKDPGVRSSGLVLRQDDSSFNVTHAGDRIAIVEERTVAVYDVGTGDQLAAVVINGEFESDYCWFDGPDTVVISASLPWDWDGSRPNTDRRRTGLMWSRGRSLAARWGESCRTGYCRDLVRRRIAGAWNVWRTTPVTH